MLVGHGDVPPRRVVTRSFPDVVRDLGGDVFRGADPVLALMLEFLQQNGVDVFLIK